MGGSILGQLAKLGCVKLYRLVSIKLTFEPDLAMYILNQVCQWIK